MLKYYILKLIGEKRQAWNNFLRPYHKVQLKVRVVNKLSAANEVRFCHSGQ